MPEGCLLIARTAHPFILLFFSGALEISCLSTNGSAPLKNKNLLLESISINRSPLRGLGRALTEPITNRRHLPLLFGVANGTHVTSSLRYHFPLHASRFTFHA